MKNWEEISIYYCIMKTTKKLIEDIYKVLKEAIEYFNSTNIIKHNTNVKREMSLVPVRAK